MNVSSKPAGWFHLTIVFHGADNGASVYYDGILMGTDTIQSWSIRTISSGKMVLGRYIYDIDDRYATVEVDELALWDN